MRIQTGCLLDVKRRDLIIGAERQLNIPSFMVCNAAVNTSVVTIARQSLLTEKVICSLNTAFHLLLCTLTTCLSAMPHFYRPHGNPLLYLYIYLFTEIELLPGGSGYFTCKQNMKLVTTEFKSGGLHEKHVVATWNVGNHLSICL